jgi:rhodanese-related sulfurtransferase
VRQIRPSELHAWLADASREQPLLLDVREPAELAVCRIEGSIPMPMHTVPARIGELDASREIVVICHHGGRSMQVAMFLAGQGLEKVINLAGGVDGWAVDVDPTMSRY